MAAGPLLRADDQPAPPPGYKNVTVNSGGKTYTYLVRQQADPLSHASFPDELDSRHIFSATNPMSNQTFSPPSDTFASGTSEFTKGDHSTFITKSYSIDSSEPTSPNLDKKVGAPSSNALSRDAAGFDQSFPTSTAETGDKSSALASSTVSNDLNHAAVLGGPDKPESLASDSMANKQYLGPGAQHVPDDVFIKENVVMSSLSGLPDRPLTIDEVRNLINHGFSPDTDVKPAEPSKALNDPNYVPEPMRADPNPNFDSAKPTPGPSTDDDKDDPVPPPGTMAAPPAPENSQPLPQP